VVPSLHKHVRHQTFRHALEVIEPPHRTDPARVQDNVLLHNGHLSVADNMDWRKGHASAKEGWRVTARLRLGGLWVLEMRGRAEQIFFF